MQVDDVDHMGTSAPASAGTSGGSLARLQRRLFKESSSSPDPADDQVQIFSAPGEGRECVEIARRVLALARDGVAFDRIAVLLRSPEQYRVPLEEAFGRAGIPAHFARRDVQIRPGGPFTFCSCVQRMDYPRAASPNTCPWDKFPMPLPRESHPRRHREVNAGLLQTKT